MKHLFLYLFSALCLTGAAILLWENRVNPPLSILAFVGVLAFGAVAFAAPADVGSAGEAAGGFLGKVAKYIPFLRAPNP